MAKSKTSASIRLNKFIAESGLTSRRKADEWIDSGRVKLNGKTVYELGVKVDPRKDKITVDGKALKAKTENKVYIVLNKPEKVVTTLSDPEGRPTVKDYLPKVKQRVFPVGRLDWDTEGLLLLTNDGEFAQSVSHPSNDIPKTYLAKLNGQPTDAQLSKLIKGVSIVGGKVKALAVERVKKGSDKYDWVKIAVTEGKNRQVRRMFERIGFDVRKLKRVAIGALPLGRIPKGNHAYLNDLGLQKVFELPSWLERNLPDSDSSGRSKKKKKKTKSHGQRKKQITAGVKRKKKFKKSTKKSGTAGNKKSRGQRPARR
ncbi:MAG: pseudouridine synthase [Pseudomonadota bacterium]